MGLLEEPLQPSLSLSCATLARPCRAAERIAAVIVGRSSETRGSAGTSRHGTYHGTSERESGASRARNPPHAPTMGRLGRSTGLATLCVRPECTDSTTEGWSGAP